MHITVSTISFGVENARDSQPLFMVLCKFDNYSATNINDRSIAM